MVYINLLFQFIFIYFETLFLELPFSTISLGILYLEIEDPVSMLFCNN